MKPVHEQQYRRAMARIIVNCQEDSPMMRVAPIAVCQMKMAISAYHGGQAKAAISMLRDSFSLWRLGIYFDCVLWVTDRVGWTKLHTPPSNSPVRKDVKLRHGRKCNGSLNCCSIDCIDESLPKWFRWLVRWDAMHK